MKKLIYFIVLLSINVFSQGEANNWFFGQNAGINFNSGSPVAVTNGKLNTIEGCASISDSDGNLLFYTDGIEVFDSTHNRMSNGNGLNGDPSSSQSAIIVPNPIDPNKYYIFTVDRSKNGPTNGLQYSIVELSTNTITSKNNPLELNTSEKITAVKSDDCSAYWVITYKNGRFYVYRVDENGVHTTPIPNNDNFYINTDRRGYLKASPDGTKIAIAHQRDAKLLVYDFDDATGTVSNEVDIPLSAPNNKPYGIEFSPSGKKLYCAASNDFYSDDYSIWNNPDKHTSSLYQIDLENTDITSAAARTILDNRNLYRGALQLAPDGKIYRALSSTYNIGSTKLGVINNPEELGISCDYQHNAIDLGGRLSTQGLPPFITSYLLPIIITDGNSTNNINKRKVELCNGDSYDLVAETIEGDPSYKWIFNNVEVSNNPDLNLTNLTPSDSGTYYLEVEIVDKCDFKIIYKGEVEIIIHENPKILPNIIYEQCDFDSDPIDGETLFNLTTREIELTNNEPNLEVTFYEPSDIDLNNPVNKTEYINSGNPYNHSLTVKVVNSITGCSSLGLLNLAVFPGSLEKYPDVYSCETDISQNNSNAVKSQGNGSGIFDFDNISINIKSIFPITVPVNVELYNNSDDALRQINKYTGTIELQPQEIFVRIIDSATKSCISGGSFNLIINPLPEPKGKEDVEVLCVNNPRDTPQLFTVLLNGETENLNDTYQWFFNGNIITDATNSTYEANAEGVYTVEATHQNLNNLTNPLDDSYCIGFNTFKVIESNVALITTYDITISDDSENNTISINNSNLGIGDYEFSLDNIDGIYQDNPYFDHVAPGIHTIYVRDKNGCGIAPLEVSVIGYPKFFTPNGDGFNDTWKVLGVSKNFYPTSLIYIFDRFGKIITQIDPKSDGWDGFYNGKTLPSADYWFSVELIDDDGNIRTKTGHFSLVRK